MRTVRLHTCTVCGAESEWTKGHSVYSSLADEEDGLWLTACSDECRKRLNIAIESNKVHRGKIKRRVWYREIEDSFKEARA